MLRFTTTEPSLVSIQPDDDFHHPWLNVAYSQNHQGKGGLANYKSRSLYVNGNMQSPPIESQRSSGGQSISHFMMDLDGEIKSSYQSYKRSFESSLNAKIAEFNIIFNRDEYIDGEISKTQIFLEKLYSEDSVIFEKLFNKVWLGLYSSGKEERLSEYILFASMLDVEMLGDNADILIVGSWSYESISVRDAILRAVESWQESKYVNYLSRMGNTGVKYLDEYKDSIIRSLEVR